MITDSELEALESKARMVRRQCLDLAYYRNPHATHLGGALSSIDILVALYFFVLKHDPRRQTWPDRDRFCLSKGHSVLGYYTVLHMAGYFSRDKLYTYGADGTDLPGHPVINKQLGIESTNGSLGMGLGVCTGYSIGAKRSGLDFHTYVLLGDGECNEGSIWEGVMAAAHHKLDNLTAIVDRNGLQQTGTNSEIMDTGNLREKFEGFGWNALHIDGHDFRQIVYALRARELGRPTAIIADTIKGKGFSFTEGNNSWHHGVMTKDSYLTGMVELGVPNV